jgi:excisionase family DNA binding protein
MTTEFFTVDEAARSANISESTLRHAIRTGKLPVSRPGPRCLLIGRLDFAAWLSHPRRGQR